MLVIHSVRRFAFPTAGGSRRWVPAALVDLAGSRPVMVVVQRLPGLAKSAGCAGGGSEAECACRTADPGVV